MTKLRLLLIEFSLALCVWALPVGSQGADKPIKVTMISPTQNEVHPFWGEYVAFMEAAASDLGIKLTVLRAGDRYDSVEMATRLLVHPEDVDYLVYIYQAKSSLDILSRAEKAGVKSFITNTGIVPNERYLVGYPRTKFKQWIGHMYPDDLKASRMLTRKLLDRATELKLSASDGKLHVVGIGGSRDTTASTFREEGLRKVLWDSSRTPLDQYVLCNWDNDLAYAKALGLLRRHPEAKVYWAASDGIALGIKKAMDESGVVPGRDAVTGGIDWSLPGLGAIEAGTMEASVGGHFMEGGWVLTLIYDYHHGRDFGRSNATLMSQMRLIDRGNLSTYLPVLDRDNWDRIDFKRFTKTHNPDLEEYDFSPDAVVRELSLN